jgi:aryl-alcohol dehydrogenase-like predicted oxidoreductase
VDSLHDIARQQGCSGSQLIPAWLLAQGNGIIPIPGTTRVRNFHEYTGAIHVRLSQDEIKNIRGTVEQATIRGERYPAAFAKTLLADTEDR